MSGFSTDVCEAFAAHLAASTAATWRASGAYSAADTWPIVLGALPAEPSQVIGLTPYPVTEDDGTGNVVQGIQVRFRGAAHDITSALDMADETWDVMNDLTRPGWAKVSVLLVWRASETPLGLDSSSRYEVTSNYYVRADRPNRNSDR